MMARPCATGPYEPRQARKGAAVSGRPGCHRSPWPEPEPVGKAVAPCRRRVHGRLGKKEDRKGV